jgi:predicted Zn finger-like uncharacterized protein
MGMVIECEKCHTKFNLDEKFLKKTGSKVRCSRCKHLFIAFPTEAELEVEEIPLEALEEVEPRPPVEEEAALAQEQATQAPEEVPQEAQEGMDFSKTMIQEYDEEIEPISIEDLPIFDEDEELEVEQGERKDIGKAMGRAAKVEERVVARDEFDKIEEVPEPRMAVRPRPVVKKKRGKGLKIILLLVLLLIAAVGAAIRFKPDFLPDYIPFVRKAPPSKQAFDIGNTRLSFKDLSGTFVNSKEAGKLFVVKGWVTNKYPDRRSYIRIRSKILDSKRAVILSKIVFAGHPLTDKELQSLPLEEIDERLRDKLGKNKMNTNVLPNASIPFVIVFNGLPEDMSEFTVEAVSSSPAGK